MEEVEGFDGDVEDLDLPWKPERLELLAKGETEPTEQELAEWRQAKYQQLADESEWSRAACGVPWLADGQMAGWTLFLCGDDPDEAFSRVWTQQARAGAARRYFRLLIQRVGRAMLAAHPTFAIAGIVRAFSAGVHSRA